MKRILTAVILIAVVVAIVLRGPLWLLSTFAALVAALAAFEYRALAHRGLPQFRKPRSTSPSGGSSLPSSLHLLLHRPPPRLRAPRPLRSSPSSCSPGPGFRAPLDRVLLDTALGLFSLDLRRLPPHPAAPHQSPARFPRRRRHRPPPLPLRHRLGRRHFRPLHRQESSAAASSPRGSPQQRPGRAPSPRSPARRPLRHGPLLSRPATSPSHHHRACTSPSPPGK